MLPITSHRTIHIPHSLAVAAALIALLSALGFEAADIGTEQDPIQAERSAMIATERANPAEDGTVDSRTEASGHRHDADCAHTTMLGLPPLVLPGIPEI